MNHVPDVERQLLDNPGGLRFDLDLARGFDLAGGDDRAGEIGPLDLDQLLRVDFGRALVEGFERKERGAAQNEQADHHPGPLPRLFAAHHHNNGREAALVPFNGWSSGQAPAFPDIADDILRPDRIPKRE